MDRILKLIAERESDFPGALLKARDLLLELISEEDGDGEALAAQAEVHYWLGIYTPDSEAREKYLAQGVVYGKQAAAMLPDSVAANFWFATCMAAHGVVRGLMNSLFYLRPLELHGNRALELDEAWFSAGPLRLMGRFYSRVPPWPVGPGDKKKGLALARRAVELAPGHLYNTVVLADAYLAARYFDEAGELLRSVLAVPEPRDFKLNHARCQAEARHILERLEQMV